ncbi:MAG: hypothetical protein COT88_01125 [Candidatus Colwellbacteria bacterium CG10_big_fil_rev_8_21_14_0_10_41_28]|uniref:Cell division protein FtsL n=1 Tax=Candidatus Colwellbacteria bacterium CG10_big_fil_rev_8_21_14_0_10_41_28 TaxID=1974539 RepID=A0A2H0VHD2_9BACT|nr:MAG: hypothetical protein COT88_01125 [Candidatus Colwellbacteria bacterium CG10_big_fil_rev_8_21_14_0_10_41_28]
MTIIKPNKEKKESRSFVYAGIICGSMLVVTVISYIGLVNTRHDLSSMRNDVEDLKVENAELKNDYYNLVKSDNLERLAEERGLVKDRNPKWALASQY